MTTLTLDELSHRTRKKLEREPAEVTASPRDRHPVSNGFRQMQSESAPAQAEWWRRPAMLRGGVKRVVDSS